MAIALSRMGGRADSTGAEMIAPGYTHKPEATLPSSTPLVFERFLPSLTLWLSPKFFQFDGYYFKPSKKPGLGYEYDEKFVVSRKKLA